MSDKYARLKALVAGMIATAGSGHYASSISALQIMYSLFYEQGVKPDEFILSKGHAAPALYAILYDLGHIDNLDGFRKYGGLPGHPELGVPGVLCSSGSLGMGISKAIGLAHANPEKTYHVLVGDGELQEGQCWEAIQNLRPNVVVHVDRNGMQYSGEAPFINAVGEGVIYHYTIWEHDNHHLTDYVPKPLPYTDILLREMEKAPEIVVLNADLEHDFGLTEIKETFPDRYFQCGISEQHMVSMANGLSLAGKIPICHTFGAFYRRAVDQMWNNACDKIRIGYVAGLTAKPEKNIGRSHEASSPRLFEMIGVRVVDTLWDFFEAIKEGGAYWELP